MPSTAFLLDVIVYGLIVAVVLPVIDLILFTMRSNPASLDFGFYGPSGSHADREQPSRRSTGRRETSEGLILAGRPTGANQKGAVRRQPSMSSKSAASPQEARSGGQAALADSPRTTGVSSRTEAPLAYVASNGIVVTPNMDIFREMEEAAADAETAAACPQPRSASVADPAVAGHPHSEYWRYGNTHFYESI